jgi:phosphoribosylglycinamide formyltransferase 2
MVTLISQDLSEFALHARAILGLPIPNIKQHGPSASVALRVDGKSDLISYSGLEDALSEPDTSLRLFGKPSINGHRRLGVVLARGASVDEAIKKARDAANKIKVEFE